MNLNELNEDVVILNEYNKKKFNIKVNGKVWKKAGKPVEFDTERHAQAVANKPWAKGKEIEIVAVEEKLPKELEDAKKVATDYIKSDDNWKGARLVRDPYKNGGSIVAWITRGRVDAYLIIKNNKVVDVQID